MADQSKILWFYTSNGEYLFGDCLTREEAISEGKGHFGGDPYGVVSGTRFQNRFPDLTDWAIDMFDDVNEDWAHEEAPSSTFTQAQIEDLRKVLLAAGTEWMMRHNLNNAQSIDTKRDVEWIIPHE